MMRITLAVLAALASLMFGVGMCRAETIDESDFWRLLEQTGRLLEQTDQTQASLDPVREQWAAVDAVRVDGSPLAIDVTWIKGALASDDPNQYRQLLRYIRALLAYHAAAVSNQADSGASLAALERVLAEARFQYAEITPTPLPTSAPEAPIADTPAASPSLPSQLILIVGGILAVVFVLLYAARLINVQPVELQSSPDDEPTTFNEARKLADDHEADRNYRAAVRYLYLSSLLLLDEHNVIRYDPSLTNREHLRQIAGKPLVSDALRQVINFFEDVWYGFEPVDDAAYEQYRRSIERLRQLVP